ncbi:type I polyketide synthase [Streptomyces sp. TP-A0356]|uniref:type I polyketide synthase n=1 Tax=Streptomyces sp. TP-A0356 TaxID=1359208 RepID=UPI0006E2B137|nr:type I polyketide synthase [Streptomyces sp. TP-A0356]
MPESDLAAMRKRLEAAEETVRQQQRTIGQFLLEKHEPMAVVGVGLRFPGGSGTLQEFDSFLREGRSGIGPLPRSRWLLDVSEGEITAQAGGFLDRIDEFDAQFFNIPPSQVPYVDPQQRLLLETAWEALEHAGIDPAGLRHSDGGIYVGASPLDFALELESLGDEQLDGGLTTGMGGYSMSGRLSYFLGWRGPSLTTDTACASSLTALHLAVEGLRRRECGIALCAAVNTLHNPRSFVILSHGQMLAPDGHCKTFDEAADGYARAEGCGALVLKRLSDALVDGDTVLALVRGTAIGQDGESAGLSAPNGTAQEAVMRAALANARLEPGDIQYVEAHGTGTPLGDPIEMGSINGVFGAAHDKDTPLTVGSLKANIGHMEPAAGLGAVIKVVAQMQAGVFYPHLWHTPSDRIPWDSYPVTVPTEGRPWKAPVRRATVNGFGVAGAIGVAVLEQAPSPDVAGTLREKAGDAADTRDTSALRGGLDDGHVFTLSAKTRPALRLQVERLLRFLEQNPGIGLADLCHTRAVGRTHFRHRLAAAVHDLDELTAVLKTEYERAPDRSAPTGRQSADTYRKAVFLFTGSGSQFAGMGRELYHRYPVFRDHVDACDALFAAILGRSVREIMFGETADAEELLGATLYTHAALFTLEYALARLWMSWGVRPSALVGHSVGEIVAAVIAGLFSLPDGVSFLATRARLIESVSRPGGMAAVSAPADEVTPRLAPWPDLAVAAVNSPRQCVISGGAESLAAAVGELREAGWTVTPLRVSSPFHSPLMAEVSEELRTALERIRFHEPELTLISNVTGRVARPEEMSTPEYWVRHLNETVQFAADVRAVDERGRHVFLEVGPSTALTSLARQCVDDTRHRWLSCLRAADRTGTTIRRALAAAYEAGLNIDWREVYRGAPGRRIPLPGYAFDRRPYRLPARRNPAGAEAHPLLGREVPDAGVDGRPGARRFTARISAAQPGYLSDHTLAGRVLLPAAAYAETLLALQDALLGTTTRPVEDLRFHEALFLTDRPVLLTTRALPTADGRLHVEILSRPADAETGEERLHATAFVAGAPADGTGPTEQGRRLLSRADASSGTAADRVIDGTGVSEAYARAGLRYGPQFSRVRSLARYGKDLAVSALYGGDVSWSEHLPPPLLDGATHGLAVLADDGHQYVATGIGQLRLFKKPRAEELRAVLGIRWAAEDGTGPVFTLDALLAEGDSPVMELSGMTFTRLARPASAAADPATATAEGGRADRALPGRAALLAAAPEERLTALVDMVRRTVAELLAIDDPDTVDAGATFLELGVDSLRAIDLKDRLEDSLRVPLASSAVFDHPTVEELADALGRRLTTAPQAATSA